MRRWIVVLLCVLMPLAARANPYIVNPSSLIAFAVVAFMALIVEAGVVALVLAFAGLSPLRMFVAYWLANVAVFLFLFWPLQQRLPLPALEALVVTVDAVSIKALSKVAAFQSDSYSRLGWCFAGAASLFGNAASFCIGVMASGEPWKIFVLLLPLTSRTAVGVVAVKKRLGQDALSLFVYLEPHGQIFRGNTSILLDNPQLHYSRGVHDNGNALAGNESGSGQPMAFESDAGKDLAFPSVSQVFNFEGSSLAKFGGGIWTNFLWVPTYVCVHVMRFLSNAPGRLAKEYRPHRDGFILLPLENFFGGFSPTTSDLAHLDAVATTVPLQGRLVRLPLRATCSRCCG